jgi:predicted transcriptional regulator
VKVVSGRDTAPPIMAAAAAVGIALILVAVKLFSRLRDHSLSEQETRRRILDSLKERPGQTAPALATCLKLHPNTVRYHLSLLATASYIATRRARGRARHFLADDARLDATSVLHAEPLRELYSLIVSNPGVRVRDVCAATSKGKTTVHYRLRLLQAAGFVRVRQDGKSLRLFPSPDSITRSVSSWSDSCH